MKILLSIRPEYVDKILDGSKRFEYRKRLYRDPDVTSIVIYATKPIGKVVGEFLIKETHTAHPDDLWESTKDYSGISKGFFDQYFEGRDVAYAIEVERVIKYQKPRPIESIIPSGVPPQSFTYIRKLERQSCLTCTSSRRAKGARC